MWPWMTLTGYLALNSVFAPVWLAETARLRKIIAWKINKDSHIPSAEQIFGRDSSFWRCHGHVSCVSRAVTYYRSTTWLLADYKAIRRWTTSSLSAGCCCVWEPVVGWDRMFWFHRVLSVIILCCLAWYCFCLFCYAVHLLLLISESCYFVIYM